MCFGGIGCRVLHLCEDCIVDFAHPCALSLNQFRDGSMYGSYCDVYTLLSFRPSANIFFLICRIISPGTFLNHTNHFCESDYTVLFSTTNSLLVLLKFELKILWTFVHLIHELNYAVYLIQIISFMYVTAQHSYNIQMFGHEIQWRSLSIQTRQLTILRK